MPAHQPGILAPLPPMARSLFFSLKADADPRPALQALAALADGTRLVVGIGPALASALQADIPGLHPLTPIAAHGVNVPSTPRALWCWLRGTDRGELMNHAHQLEDLLHSAFYLEQVIDTFLHRHNRDLTGYEDGTENPEGDDALAAAIAADGSSMVALQLWRHDFSAFEKLSRTEQDHIIGRRRDDNEELDDAPESAHVKRTAQESFTPEAFVFRRSMPWADGQNGGLLFAAFGHSLRAFDVQMQRMAGLEDGITDGLFRISQPLTGDSFWCPPLKNGHPDFSLLGMY
jgi:putative iron-dependent peroxidase